MKYELTQEDHQTMARDLQTDRTLKHLKNLSFYKFSVGDVLIREDKYHKYDGSGTFEWKVKTADCNLPYKYVYAFENELGIGYIRRLSVNGRKFVERPICVTEFDPDQTRFALDPEYADHMLLSSEDEEFDSKSRYDEIKKRREQINRKNKKIALNFATEADVITWFQTLKVGDQFWYGYSIGSIAKDPYFVHEINLQATPADPQKTYIPYNGYFSQMFSPHIRVNTQQPNGMSNGFTSTLLHAHNLMRYYVFTQRPAFLDEVIN